MRELRSGKDQSHLAEAGRASARRRSLDVGLLSKDDWVRAEQSFEHVDDGQAKAGRSIHLNCPFNTTSF